MFSPLSSSMEQAFASRVWNVAAEPPILQLSQHALMFRFPNSCWNSSCQTKAVGYLKAYAGEPTFSAVSSMHLCGLALKVSWVEERQRKKSVADGSCFPWTLQKLCGEFLWQILMQISARCGLHAVPPEKSLRHSFSTAGLQQCLWLQTCTWA